jgi:hypothetical protein
MRAGVKDQLSMDRARDHERQPPPLVNHATLGQTPRTELERVQATQAMEDSGGVDPRDDRRHLPRTVALGRKHRCPGSQGHLLDDLAIKAPEQANDGAMAFDCSSVDVPSPNGRIAHVRLAEPVWRRAMCYGEPT